MKILFLTHPLANYVPDFLLHGLREIFGPDVIEYPRKDCLYQGSLGLAVSPKDQLCPGWFPDDHQVIDRSDINEKINQGYFDIVCSDIRAVPQFQNFILNYPKPVVLIDGEDRAANIQLDKILFFSREGINPNLSRPLPMAMPKSIYKIIESYHQEQKIYDIGFLGSQPDQNDPRSEWLSQLENRGYKTKFSAHQQATPHNPQPEGRLSRLDYYQELSKCKIVLNLSGAGHDTFRFWENCSMQACHISQKSPLIIPNPFPQSNAFDYVENGNHLQQTIQNCLSQFDQIGHEIRAMQDHLKSHHFTTHRAQYFIDECKSYFNF